ncbi:MAG: methyl-accepting chemotaxis protein [Beijerinckiaceae bacterium]|nr:methyl-accepting chemotaxis protein [Beijerinckiaceae bacterium]
MALVKTSALSGKRGPRAAAAPPLQLSPRNDKPRTEAKPKEESRPAPERTAAKLRKTTAKNQPRHEKAIERVAAATEELAAGITQAATAAEEFGRSLEQIASAAEQSAGAAHESQSAIQSVVSIFSRAREQADLARRKTGALQTTLIEAAAQIRASVTAVRENAVRQLISVDIASALENHAVKVSEITRIVSEISDQTNLLALNAAIEAARAGENGRPFAVVADEVRAFAATSEKSANDVQEIAAAIGADVRAIASRIKAAAAKAEAEAVKGQAIIATLDALRGEFAAFGDESQNILLAMIEAESGAREAQRGAALVASAAEEQSAATAQCQQTVRQQGISLDQSQQTAHSLARMAEGQRTGAALTAGSGSVAAAAEELSATVQELSSSASEILAAIEQISRGAQAQAAATLQSNAALVQIEKAAAITNTAAGRALERTRTALSLLLTARDALLKLRSGLEAALQETKAITAIVTAVETSSRRIGKIINSISLVAVQTNILAVSGSVEAARAGELGRGFAIVSSDIRELARDSSLNASLMEDVVDEIRDQIAAVRRDLDQIAGTMAPETEKNRAIAGQLEAVEAELKELRDSSGEILTASEAIVTAVRDVSAGTGQIAAAAEETSAATAEAATVARQQARGAEDLAAAIEEIASLAVEFENSGRA